MNTGAKVCSVTTPTSTLVGFSVHPPAQRPVSPKAVPRPVQRGVTWEYARLGISTAGARHTDHELFTWRWVTRQNAQSSVVYVQDDKNKCIIKWRFWQEKAVNRATCA